MRRSVGAATRRPGGSGQTGGGGTPNNAPAMVVYSGTGVLVGNPLDTGNGSPTGITDAKLVEWVTQRAIAGLTFSWEMEPSTQSGSTQAYNPSTGALPTGDTPSIKNAWWQESNKLKWGATPNTRTWWQRCVELGVKNYVVTGLCPSSDNTHVLGTTWENDTTWGASTVAGALTPTGGSRLADIINWAKVIQHTNDSIAGFTGILFNLEASDSTPFRHPYPGMPGAQSEATTRAKIKLRGAQIEKIVATHAPSITDLLLYFDRGTDSWNELEYDDSVNGAQGAHPFSDRCYDSFTAGLAGGTTRYTQIDEVFYRGVGLGQENATGYKNAQIYNLNGRNARQTNALVTQTDAERLKVMRNTNRAMFMWPAEGGGPGGEGWSSSFATNVVPTLIQQSVLWSQRFHAVYAQSHYANQTFDDGTSFPNRNYNLYEAAWQQYLVSAVAQSTSPTLTVTTVNGSPFSGSTYTTSGTTITVGGTASDDFALSRIEWSNAANALSGAATMTLTIDSPWDVHDATKLPKNTGLGAAAWHMNWATEAIPLVAGTNVITFRAYNIHDLVTTVTLTVTTTSHFTMFQSRYPATGAEIWVDGTLGNDTFAGTPAAPKATIQAAINVSVAGSKIMVRPYGPGYATITFAGHSGTASNYIQLIASGATSMFSPGAKINCNGGAGSGSAGVSMIGNNNNFIAMWGFEVTGLNSSSAPYEVGVMPGNGAHDVAVWGCYFHDLASHAVAAPGAGGQGWAGVDRIDVCYNRITHTSRWNPYQGSGISMISQANIGGAWADGYRNHIIGNVIDGVFTDPNAPGLTPNFITDGNSIIFDISGGYAGRTLVAHNVTVGAGGRGIHTLSFNGIDAWFNTSCDSIQNLPGTWVGEFSIQDSSDCHFGWNVGAAKVGSNRVGNFQNPGTSTWSDTVFLRGTGGSEGNDPSVNSFNNINKTGVGPAAYFNQYQQGVYQQTVITNVAGFRPKLAQVVTGNPPANIRAAVAPWPDALGVLRPASGPWAYGAFEAA